MATKKFSRKREAIYAVFTQSHSHPSAEAIYAQLKPRFPDLSLGTVYRNIAAFKQEGLLNPVAVVGGQERLDHVVESHPHFVCDCCGAVMDAPSPPLPTEFPDMAGYSFRRCDIVYHGLCDQCNNKK